MTALAGANGAQAERPRSLPFRAPLKAFQSGRPFEISTV